MWAVLTITGRVDVLGKETESQVEMGTVGSVKARTKATGNELRKRLGRRLEVPRDVVPFLVARSVSENDIAPRDDLSRRTCGTFPKVLESVFRRK